MENNYQIWSGLHTLRGCIQNASKIVRMDSKKTKGAQTDLEVKQGYWDVFCCRTCISVVFNSYQRWFWHFKGVFVFKKLDCMFEFAQRNRLVWMCVIWRWGQTMVYNRNCCNNHCNHLHLSRLVVRMERIITIFAKNDHQVIKSDNDRKLHVHSNKSTLRDERKISRAYDLMNLYILTKS